MATLSTITFGTLSATCTTDGGELISLKKDGVEYLWQRDTRWWGGTNPVLFPFVGSLRNNFAHSPAGDITLPRHGLARKASHELVQAREDRVDYLLASTDETRANYPYDFELRMGYALQSDTTIAQTFTVINTGDSPMPFCVGAHPAFNVPLAPDAEAGDAFSSYELRFAEPWSYATPAIGLDDGIIDWSRRAALLDNESVFVFNHRTFDVDTLVWENVPGNTVSLVSRNSGHGVRLDFPGFDYLGVWSAAGDAPFVAVEPWCGCATGSDEDDDFCHKRGVTLLPAGETFERTYTITVR